MSVPRSEWRAVRWVLPLLSLAPIGFAVFEYYTATGPPDQKVGAEVALLFLLGPPSLILALISAVVAAVNWKAWHPLDRAAGFAPIVLFGSMPLLAYLKQTYVGGNLLGSSNPSIQRTEASRLAQPQFMYQRRLASTADADLAENHDREIQGALNLHDQRQRAGACW